MTTFLILLSLKSIDGVKTQMTANFSRECMIVIL
uniref:Uncharacterized protein n=1 Tax=virus sp. cti5L29 TaxID=2826813 RepID=A0A8S5R892_9VIRU|nr:MAG TPA: hypothetical protein [virus sp. cti5L29]